jgi:hypothetical protein
MSSGYAHPGAFALERGAPLPFGAEPEGLAEPPVGRGARGLPAPTQPVPNVSAGRFRVLKDRNVDVLLDDDDISITFEAGESRTAVVSFTGIGHRLGAIQTPEFQKTLGGVRASGNVYYVIDKKRRWYNGLEDKIQRTLASHMARRRIAEVYTLGNSMGGFGAILFAGRLPHVVRAVAFCPQSSVNSEHVPFEKRWQAFVQAIPSWTVPDVLPRMTRKVEYLIFFNGGDGLDRCHADRFIASAPKSATVWLLDGHTHNLTSGLKDKGLLGDILYHALSSERGVLEKVDDVLSRGARFQREACGPAPGRVGGAVLAVLDAIRKQRTVLASLRTRAAPPMAPVGFSAAR